MKAYQIKVTKLSGQHEGHSYILTKGGYVATEGSQHIDDCYLTERVAKMVCTKLRKSNIRDHEDEAYRRHYREAAGKQIPDWWIYDLEKYEPIEVECWG